MAKNTPTSKLLDSGIVCVAARARVKLYICTHIYAIHTSHIRTLYKYCIYTYTYTYFIYTHIYILHRYFIHIHTYFIYIHTCPLSRYHHPPSLLSAQAGPFKASVMFITQVSEECWAYMDDGERCSRKGKKAGPVCESCYRRLSEEVSVFGIVRTTPLLRPHHADRSEGCMWGI